MALQAATIGVKTAYRMVSSSLVDMRPRIQAGQLRTSRGVGVEGGGNAADEEDGAEEERQVLESVGLRGIGPGPPSPLLP